MARKAARTQRVKATFRMDPANVAALERERMRRIVSGVPRSKASVSELVNEAVRLAFRGGR